VEISIEDKVCYWCDDCCQYHPPDKRHDPQYRTCDNEKLKDHGNILVVNK
jgi:hypothetical protein